MEYEVVLKNMFAYWREKMRVTYYLETNLSYEYHLICLMKPGGVCTRQIGL